MKLTHAFTAALLIASLSSCATRGMQAEDQAAMKEGMAPISKAARKEAEALNGLASIYIDASTLYREAAALPDKNNGVREKLTAIAEARDSELELLRKRIIKLGVQPRTRGEALGTGHRAFTQLRTMTDKDTTVAIEEVLRGERYIVDQIRDCTKRVTTAESRTLLNALSVSAAREVENLVALDKAM